MQTTENKLFAAIHGHGRGFVFTPDALLKAEHPFPTRGKLKRYTNSVHYILALGERIVDIDFRTSKLRKELGEEKKLRKVHGPRRA